MPVRPSHGPWPHYAGQSISKCFNKGKTVLPESLQTEEIIAPLEGSRYVRNYETTMILVDRLPLRSSNPFVLCKRCD